VKTASVIKLRKAYALGGAAGARPSAIAEPPAAVSAEAGGRILCAGSFHFDLRFSAAKTVTIITWAGYIFK